MNRGLDDTRQIETPVTDTEILNRVVALLRSQIDDAHEMRVRGTGYGDGYGAAMVRDAERDSARASRVLDLVEGARRGQS